MIVDALCQVCDAQAFTAAAVSSSCYDAGDVTPKRILGDGEPLGYAFVVTTAASCTTVKVEAIMASATDLTTGQIVLAERTGLAADFAAGKSFFLELPPSAPAAGYLRYHGVKVTPVGGSATVSLDAYLMPRSMFAVAKPQNYAKGYSV